MLIPILTNKVFSYLTLHKIRFYCALYNTRQENHQGMNQKIFSEKQYNATHHPTMRRIVGSDRFSAAHQPFSATHCLDRNFQCGASTNQCDALVSQTHIVRRIDPPVRRIGGADQQFLF